MFYNREKELALLRKLASGEGFSFVYLIGRRRIGKTSLVFEALGDVPYLLLPKNAGESALRNIFRLNLGFSAQNLAELLRLHFSSRRVLFIDEVQNIGAFPLLLSELQQGVDWLERSGAGLLVAAGSSISLTSQLFENSQSPLYRRAHARIFLPPLPLSEALKWGLEIAKGDLENALTLTLCFGGIPYYYRVCEKFYDGNPKRLLKELFFSPNSLLAEEAEAVLSSEFRGKYTVFRDIIFAVGLGKTREAEIASFLQIKQTTLHKYVNFLEKHGFLGRQAFISKRRKSLYIKDPVLDLLFSCTSGNFEKCFDVFCGRRFESLIRENLEVFTGVALLEAGKYLGKRPDGGTFEIDIVGEGKDEVFLGECKWGERVDGPKIEKSLQEKAALFPTGKRKRLLIFARAFRRRPRKALAFDLEEIGKLLFSRKNSR